MAAQPTIQETINIGKATIYLMSNDYSKGSLFGARLTKESSAVLIDYTTSALEWQYNSLPNTDTLRGTANYLLWLCGKYKLEAQGLSGGGSVIPINPALTLPQSIEFEVSGSTIIPSGGSAYTFTQYIGYNLIFVRGNLTQSTINQGNTYYTWNRVTGEFTCIGVANAGELFQFYPTI